MRFTKSNRPQLVTIPPSNESTKPCRPYTEYNLFFQLEREYIIQAELGFQPDYECADVFDPSDLSNYQGPPLPSKYRGLTYLKDWHLPGKEKRRKRRHRKTHGKIGFRQLSLRIAEAWKHVDEETLKFCIDLRNIGLIQHKNQVAAYKAAHPEEEEEISVKNFSTAVMGQCMNDENEVADATACRSVPSMFNVSPCNPAYLPTHHCSLADVDAAFENDFSRGHNTFNEMISATDDSVKSSLAPTSYSFVDVEDDEIINIWKSVHEDAVSSDAWVSARQVSPRSSVSHSPVSSVQSLTSSCQDNMTCASSPDGYPLGHNIDSALNVLKYMRNVMMKQQEELLSSFMASKQRLACSA
jgi:hypothetical protein